MEENQARVNVTYGGANGDLPDPVMVDATDAQIRAWVTETVRGGGIPGVAADATADFTDFVIDRFGPNETRNYNLIQVRPKTAYGR